jgi:hypothetical protein
LAKPLVHASDSDWLLGMHAVLQPLNSVQFANVS